MNFVKHFSLRSNCKFTQRNGLNVLIVFVIAFGVLLNTRLYALLTPEKSFNLPAKPPAAHKITGRLSDNMDSRQFIQDGKKYNWSVIKYKSTLTVGIAYGSPIPLVVDLKSDQRIISACDLFLNNNLTELDLDGCDFALIELQHSRKYIIASYVIQHSGVEVNDSYIVLSINNVGALSLIKTRSFGSNVIGDFSINSSSAEIIARESVEIETGKIEMKRVLLPVEEGSQSISLKPAYKTELAGSNPGFQPTLYIDGSNGKILSAENRVTFVELEGETRGFYHPMYGPDDEENGPFEDEWITAVSADGDTINSVYSSEEADYNVEVGEDFPIQIQGFLKGRFVETGIYPDDDNPEGISSLYEAEIENADEPHVIEWNNENSREDERNLFFHVNAIHDYWKALDEDLRMDYPIFAVCNVGGEGLEQFEDNAFSGPNGIFFGRGNRLDNFAMYADVIYHEYTHTVTGVVYRNHQLPYQGESGALNEAWSDYFPCSFTDDPLIGEGGLIPGGGRIRSLVNNLLYPRDIQDEVHADSRIISAAMWETRETLGMGFCDSLFHYARDHHARDFRSYLLDVYLTDDDDGDLTNGTPHYQEIFEPFARHGINAMGLPAYMIRNILISDSEENGIEGNGNGVFDFGEIVGINVEVYRGGRINQEDSDTCVVRFVSNHDLIDPVRNNIELPNISVGEWGELLEPLLFEIVEGELSWAEIVIEIAPLNGEFEPYDTLEIVLGQPQVALVKDGAEGRDRSEYFAETLDEMGIIYGKEETANTRIAFNSYLSGFETVIWFTGDDRNQILEPNSRDAMGHFLDNGGNILLTGQSAGEVEGSDEFFETYFGARNLVDSTGQRDAVGVEGDPITGGMQVLFLGGDAAYNQRRVGIVEAIEPAVEIFHYPRIDSTPAAGTRFINEELHSKSVYLAFGLEAVIARPRFSSRLEIITAIFDWFNISAVEDDNNLPLEFSIGVPYPNPFNSQIKIPFSLPIRGNVEFGLFDITGRQIWYTAEVFTAGNRNFGLNAIDLNSGVYVIQIKTSGVVESRRIVLIK